MQNIDRVCILGGTHGNELSGVYLVKHYQKNPDVFMRPTFETKACISNPKAVEVNRRYIDVDLNRSFTPENYAAKLTVDTPYEVKRVQELKAMFNDGGEIGRCDLVLDLHNTTANTRVCLIHKQLDPFTMQLMHYVSNQLPAEMCYCLYFEAGMKYPDSRTLAPYGIGIEVGPQPQGVLRADICNLQGETLKHCLDFVESFNTGSVFAETSFHTYELLERVPFPRDEEGAISVMLSYCQVCKTRTGLHLRLVTQYFNI